MRVKGQGNTLATNSRNTRNAPQKKNIVSDFLTVSGLARSLVEKKPLSKPIERRSNGFSTNPVRLFVLGTTSTLGSGMVKVSIGLVAKLVQGNRP